MLQKVFFFLDSVSLYYSRRVEQKALLKSVPQLVDVSALALEQRLLLDGHGGSFSQADEVLQDLVGVLVLHINGFLAAVSKSYAQHGGDLAGLLGRDGKLARHGDWHGGVVELHLGEVLLPEFPESKKKPVSKKINLNKINKNRKNPHLDSSCKRTLGPCGRLCFGT